MGRELCVESSCSAGPPAGLGDLCGYVMDRSAYTLFRALLLGSSERDSAHEAASMG